jgi:hypothetical protein
MELVFQRWLVIPLSTLAFVAVALTAPPPATLSLLAAVAIAVATRKLGPRSHASQSVTVLPQGRRNHGSATMSVAGTAGARRLDEPAGTTADDAVDLGRMDDDGGSQMARPLT